MSNLFGVVKSIVGIFIIISGVVFFNVCDKDKMKFVKILGNVVGKIIFLIVCYLLVLRLYDVFLIELGIVLIVFWLVMIIIGKISSDIVSVVVSMLLFKFVVFINNV